MIIVSAGMPKSGSAYYLNLTNDLLVATGKMDTKKIRTEFKLESILVNQNSKIESLEFETLYPVLIPHYYGNTFAIKTHAPPTDFLDLLVLKKIAKATYIFRDPRDVIISAIDHGKLARRLGQNNVFLKCKDVETTIPFVMKWLAIWEKWVGYNDVLIVRYENLINNTLNEILRFARYLSLDIDKKNVEKVISNYSKENIIRNQINRLNFNKGYSGRFRSVLTKKEIDKLNKIFGKYLLEMGYK